MLEGKDYLALDHFFPFNHSYADTLNGHKCGSQYTTAKKAIWKLFGPHCKFGLDTLKFHLLDNLMNYLELFGTIQVPCASLYELFNFIL